MIFGSGQRNDEDVIVTMDWISPGCFGFAVMSDAPDLDSPSSFVDVGFGFAGMQPAITQTQTVILLYSNMHLKTSVESPGKESSGIFTMFTTKHYA